MKKHLVFGLAIICLMTFKSLSFSDVKIFYEPQKEKSYKSLKKIYKNISKEEVGSSINLSRNEDAVFLLDNILKYLSDNRFLKQNTDILPIFTVDLIKNETTQKIGALYNYDKDHILVNSSLIKSAMYQPSDPEKHQQAALDFITASAAILHEFVHYEDMKHARANSYIMSHLQSEKNAYARMTEVLDSFIDMNEEQASKIPIPDFYTTLRDNRHSIMYLRNNYMMIAKATEILLQNEGNLCKELQMDYRIFSFMNFIPSISSYRDGIVAMESAVLSFPIKLKCTVDTESGLLRITSSPEEIASLKEYISRITIS